MSFKLCLHYFEAIWSIIFANVFVVFEFGEFAGVDKFVQTKREAFLGYSLDFVGNLLLRKPVIPKQ